MHFFTRFRTYFNPRTPVFIKARQQSAGIKDQQEIISCFPYFTRMLIFCQIGAWMLRKLGQGMRSGLSGRHGCAGLVQFLRIFSKGWCVLAGRSLESFPSLESMVQHNPDFTHHFVQTYTRDSHPFADIGNLYLC